MNIGPDKFQHFIAGMLITVVAGIWRHPYQGFTLAVVIAGVKEAYDIRGHGTADWLDFFATVLGAMSGYVVVRLVKIGIDLFATRQGNP